MQNPQPIKTVSQPPATGLSLGDIYYTLFRHKWMIILCSTAGIIVAAVLFLTTPPLYRSETKILVRYVETKSAAPAAGDSQVKPLDSQGDGIISAELEILTSLDLALLVADAVGPEKVLARVGGGTNRNDAAGVIRGGLSADAPRRSNIIRILFSHRDPEVVQPVLRQVVDAYLKKHLEIHQGVGLHDDFYSRQADQLRSRLAHTEEDLKKARSDLRMVSLEDTKKTYLTQIGRIQDNIFAAEAELAERKAVLDDVQKSSVPGTNDPAADAIPRKTVAQYKSICTRLDSLENRRQQVLSQFTEEHPLATRLQGQIVEVETQKEKMEAEYPGLAALRPDLSAETARISSLVIKIKVLNEQLDKIRTEAIRVIDEEPAIMQLQRKRELEESKYRYYSSSIEQARINETLGAGKITNISMVQAPSPAVPVASRVIKPVAQALAAGILGGLALAFLIDLVLDRSIKRAIDVERCLGLSVFLSVPDSRRNGGFRFPKFFRNGHRRRLAAPDNTPTLASEAPQPPALWTEVAPWDPRHALHVYYEALRDRLITNFESHSMTHKPKLIAVTSCNRGAGVTTLAAGLAASLSETGDGKVLLVDMNADQGAAHPFYKGKPGCGLSEALEPDKPDTALVQENLYVVSAHETSNSLLPRILPRRFAHLVPKMKASDYDYIIFDMPPVTATSVTPRLSGFMDMVLMVIESEKTGPEIAKRAHALLRECRANVIGVLNKNRAYLPERLRQEL